jgi:hypothetical protein
LLDGTCKSTLEPPTKDLGSDDKDKKIFGLQGSPSPLDPLSATHEPGMHSADPLIIGLSAKSNYPIFRSIVDAR